MKKIESSVVRLQIRVKNQQRILFDFNNDITSSQLQNSEKLRQIILIEFFKMNQRVKNVENANLSLSYEYLNINKNFSKITFIKIFLNISFEKRRKKFEFCERKLNVLTAYFS